MTASASIASTLTAPDRARRNAARRRELARFLRQARERITPDEVGLVVSARRRAPGLLREEVAQLATISSSWYSWLEQGRSIQVSEQVLDAVARGLRLSGPERDYVFRLAQPAPLDDQVDHEPADQADPEHAARSWGLRRMVHHISDAPAYVIDRSWNILEWNGAATALFEVPLAEVPPVERNALRFALLGRGLPLRFADPVAAARAHVAQFRADTSDLIGVHAYEEQIEALLRDSGLFRLAWPHREVRHAPAQALTYQHSTHGRLQFDFVATDAGDDTSLRMHAFLPRTV